MLRLIREFIINGIDCKFIVMQNKLIAAVLIITVVNSSSFPIRYSVYHADNAVQLNFSRKPSYN